MHKLIFGFIFILIMCANAQSSGAQQKMECSDIDECTYVLTAHLSEYEDDTEEKIPEYEIAKAFGKFGPKGWDALFALMEQAESKTQDIVISALSDLSRTRGHNKLSDYQFNKFVEMWEQEPSFLLCEILSRTDRPRAHEIIINALGGDNKEKRSAAWATLKYTGIGQEASEIKSVHLFKVLEILKTKPDSNLVEIIGRMKGPLAQAAMWKQLASDNLNIFNAAYDILNKQNPERLEKVIYQQNGRLTKTQRFRALMIGNKLVDTPDKIEFYETQYNNKNLTQTSQLISFAVLLNMQAKANKDRNVERAALLNGILLPNEDRFRRYFFDIIEARIQTQTTSKNRYGQTYPMDRLTSLTKDHIKTPKKWVGKVREYLKDERVIDKTQILDFLARYDLDTEFLASMVLQNLEQDKYWQVQSHAMLLIAGRDDLRYKPKLRARMEQIAQEHLITRVRAAAFFALSETTPTSQIKQAYSRGYYWQRDGVLERINKNRTYCLPPKGIAAPSFGALPKFPEFSLNEGYDLGAFFAPQDAIKTNNGWLVGYNHGEFGGGVAYYADGALEGQNLNIQFGYPHNVIRIIKGKKDNVYWVVTGLLHFVDWGSVIHKVEIKGGIASIKTVKHLPETPRKITVTENGDMFMDFTAAPSQIYDSDNNAWKTIPNSKYDYNPPLFFTKNGQLKSGC